MRAIVGVQPEYHNYHAREFAGNPCIEAIFPPPATKRENLRRLALKPTFDEEEIKMPAQIRKLLPFRRLRSFFYPNECHSELLSRVYSVVINGYQCRPNPLSRDGHYYLHNAGRDGFSLNKEAFHGCPPMIMLYTGLPGSGKSESMNAAFNALGPTVIQHSQYKEEPFTEVQVLRLGVEMPPRATLREVAKEACEQANHLAIELVGNLTAQFSSSAVRGDYVRALRKAVAGYHVGAFVLDSAEHISLVGSKGIGELFAFLVNLRDSLGVPIILIGTYSFEDQFYSSASAAQRICDGLPMRIKHATGPEDPWFSDLCKVMWGYQWVKRPAEWKADLVAEMYEYSQGIVRVLIDVFVAAQMRAIDDGSERVDAALLKRVFERDFTLLHPSLKALASGDEGAKMKFEGLFPKAYVELERTGKVPNALAKVQSDIERQLSKHTPAEPTPVRGGRGRGNGSSPCNGASQRERKVTKALGSRSSREEADEHKPEVDDLLSEIECEDDIQ